MAENNEWGFERFFPKKAYEISYAAFRVAGIVKSEGLADEIFHSAVGILYCVEGKYKESQSAARHLEYIMRLLGDTGVVSYATTRAVVEELERFSVAIEEYMRSIEAPSVSLEGVFSEVPVPTNPPISNISMPDMASHMEEQSAVRSAMRQSAILEIIRQTGNLPDRPIGCRLKDIQDLLHGTSERTIRYDIEGLMEKGMVERVHGGPNTRYRTKAASVPHNNRIERQ